MLFFITTEDEKFLTTEDGKFLMLELEAAFLEAAFAAVKETFIIEPRTVRFKVLPRTAIFTVIPRVTKFTVKG